MARRRRTYPVVPGDENATEGASGLTAELLTGFSDRLKALETEATTIADDRKMIEAEIKGMLIQKDMFKLAHKLRTKVDPATATFKIEAFIQYCELMGLRESLFTAAAKRGDVKIEDDEGNVFRMA